MPIVPPLISLPVNRCARSRGVPPSWFRQRLENSEASLEEAFEALEAGSQAYRSCHRTLEAARERVEIILRDFPDAEPRRVPFGETGDSGLDDPTDDGS